MDFKQAWRHMEAQGYRYGDSALNNVEMGWDMAHGKHGVPGTSPGIPAPPLSRDDLKISVVAVQPQGWGYWGSDVTVHHLPSGLSVTSHNARSQHSARHTAMVALEAAVMATQGPKFWAKNPAPPEACCVKGIMEPSGICEDCKKESQGYSSAMGVTDDEKRKRAIEAWTKVAQKAGISLIGGKKFLCLDEDMCLELGLAFEALGWVHHEEG